jgi:putative transposase
MMHSEKFLLGGEFVTINTENSIIVVDQMVDRYWWLRPMRELIMDHGSEFGTQEFLKMAKMGGSIQKPS